MRPYEVMVIYDAELDDADIQAAVDRSTTLLTSKGAELGPVDRWGKRPLAYRLNRKWEGYYVVLQARSEPAVMDELSHALSLADEVLRHKVLRIPEKVYGTAGGTSGPPPVITAAVAADVMSDDISDDE